ncbi:hypothetical protein OKW76_06975 [Sphingomonas sp. S1-29]|uniref:hypothetical protein n=1 Tax=Sphingomonas sp. S1-29 TaxID=2991074 RepID=UPI00223EF40C|nr:hypothetical protein [Sphingomonas sp. S1-29]UZK70757.1 hypothetical protein OKW76_06975 [Sphingomonas sp. S1-29]
MSNKLNIGTFMAGRAMVDPDNGHPTIEFLRQLNSIIQQLGKQTNANTELLGLIELALEQAGIAILTAEEARDAAMAGARDQNLVNSYVDPGAVLSCADLTITVLPHDRVYGDGTRVSVAGATLSVPNYSTRYWITYLDPARTGGAVTYVATANYLDAAQAGDRHVVGDIITPADATSPGTGGNGPRPPGTGPWEPLIPNEVQP